MKLRPAIIVALCAVLAGCTSAGAPKPGERAEQMLCEAGDLKVCTGVGAGIKQEEAMCSCSSFENIYQF